MIATFEEERDPENKAADSEYRKYVDLACKYKNERACEIRNDLIEKGKSEQMRTRLIQKTKCAMTKQEVVQALGQPNTSSGCTDNTYESYKYGRSWIVFRSNAAYLIMDHKDYAGPCVGGYSRTTGVFICENE